MNEQLINKLLEYLQNVEQFASKQIPDFVDQFIKYETWKCEWLFKIWLVIMSVFFVLSLIAFIVGMIKDDAAEAIRAMIFTGIIFLISMFVSISNYIDIRQIEIAPKVYMINQARNFATTRQCRK